MTVRCAAAIAALLMALPMACSSSGEQVAAPSNAPLPTPALEHPSPAPAQPPPPSTDMTTPSQPTSGTTSAPLLNAADDWIQYAVGNPSFRGRTTVKVAGTGAVEVSFEHAGKTDRYAGKLEADELRGLRDTLTANDPRALKSAKATGNPDEARIALTVHGAGGDAKIELWDSEQWKMPPLRALVVAFNAIASKTSGGKVKY